MQLSLMTISMFIRIFYGFYMSKDMEEARELYEEMMQMTRAAGYDTVEITSRETSLFGVEGVQAVLRQNGLSVGAYMFMDNLDMPTAAVKEAVLAAETFSADRLMLIPYWHTSLEGKSRDEIHRIYAERWREAVALAAEKGIQTVVEDTPDQRLQLCKAEDVKHFLSLLPTMKLVYDSGNMILAGEDPVAYAREMKDQIDYVHLKDMKVIPASRRGADVALDGRGMTGARHGDGLIPLEDVVRELRAQGYEGRWVVELSMDNSETYPQAVTYAREKAEALLG